MSDDDTRRPLKVRGIGLFKAVARSLSQKQITPNQISITSIFFAGLSAGCFVGFRYYGDWWWLLLAALFIQFRLLCNLFDGMVAIEGGKSTKSGELFNDIPDRIADPLILVSAGYAISVVEHGNELGWCAGLLAVMTAYVRTLNISVGAPVDFRGPMAKQHRMALITFASLLAAIETLVWQTHYTLPVALGIIIIGCIITCGRRAVAAYRYLEGSS